MNHRRYCGGVIALWIGVVMMGGGCRTGRGGAPAWTDPELERMNEAAQAAVAAGSPAGAAELYAAALRRARVVDDGESIARLAYNLGICRAQAGDVAGAREALHEARAESRPGGELDGLTWLAEARLLRQAGRPREAWEVLETARRRLGDAVPKTVRGSLHLLAAGIQADLKDNAAARDELTRAQAGLARVDAADPRLAAEAAGLDGELLARDHQYLEAARAFDHEAERWRTARDYAAMSAALARAGRAYARAGRDESAADRYFRAARSRRNAGAGDTPEAREWLARARECAEKAGWKDGLDRMR